MEQHTATTNKKAPVYTNEEIYDTLVNEIISLDLPPKQQISETEIAKRFGVSRTPVRDIFKRLASNSLIEIQPQRHTIISHIDFKDITDLMFIREKLEVGILEEAIDNFKKIPTMQLHISLAKQKNLIGDDSIDIHSKSIKFLALDNTFHLLLYSVTGRKSIWNILGDRLHNYLRYRTISAEIHTLQNLEELYEHHQLLVTALDDKDCNLLREIYKSHLYSGANKIPLLMERYPHYFD